VMHEHHQARAAAGLGPLKHLLIASFTASASG
jgi:hypothetical protein